MKEILKSLFDSSKERIKSPIIGAFMIAWLVFNWKAIFIILFASKTIENKIVTVEDNYSEMGTNLWWPMTVAILYVLLLPYIMWLFDEIVSRAQRGRKKAILNGQIFDTISKKRLAIEEIELEKVKAEYNNKLDLNKKIETLEAQVEKRNEMIKSLQEEIKENREIQIELKEALNQQNDQTLTRAEIEKFQISYTQFKESDIYRFFESLGTEVSRRERIPSDIGDLVIEKYIHQGIIKESVNHEEQRTTYKFTKLGHYFWRQFLSSIRIIKKEKTIDPDPDLPF